MLAALAQLHHKVEEQRPLLREALVCLVSFSGNSGKTVQVLEQDCLVPERLNVRHGTVHPRLELGRELGLDVRLEAPEHEEVEQPLGLDHHRSVDVVVLQVEGVDKGSHVEH